MIGISFYIASFVGDLFDGMAARKLNQTSQFGGLLDMITDRCATLGLLILLSNEYSHGELSNIFQWTFLCLILLDISSHWCQMYAAATFQQHHKDAESNHFALVRWYYQYYFFFGYCCVGTEVTYISLYVLSQLYKLEKEGMGIMELSQAIYVWERIILLCVPACVMKQIVNVSQLCSACYTVAKHDAEKKQK